MRREEVIARQRAMISASRKRNWGSSNIHIDGGKTTVGDGAADGTSQGETRVERESLELLGLGESNLSSSHRDGSS